MAADSKPIAKIGSIQVGLPRELGCTVATGPAEPAWYSGILKAPVEGPIRVGKVNLEGDGQADLVHHGGVDKAVLAYSAAHYALWCVELGIGGLSNGAFGENLTVEGTAEREVCIGDIWKIGDVLLQVSQPRQPCWKLGRRWHVPDLPKRVLQTGRSGWYLRVLREGTIERGLDIHLEQRLYPQWTVIRTAELRYDKAVDQESVAELAELPELSTTWRQAFAAKRAEDFESAD